MKSLTNALWIPLVLSIFSACGQQIANTPSSTSTREPHQQFSEQSYSNELLEDEPQQPAEPTNQEEFDYAVSRQLRAGPMVHRLMKQIPEVEGQQLFKEQLRVIDAQIDRVKQRPDLANAEEVARRGYITGCLDFATIYGSLLREQGLKVAYIHGVDIEWIRRKQSGEHIKRYKGHAFIQVFYEGRWQLIDPAGGRLYPDCPLQDKVLPSGYILQYKSADLWSLGIRNIRDLNRAMDRFAYSVRLPLRTSSSCTMVKLRSPGQQRRRRFQ